MNNVQVAFIYLVLLSDFKLTCDTWARPGVEPITTGQPDVYSNHCATGITKS